MTLTRLFAETFSPLMEANGFMRRRNGFYRIYGDDILQAICVKPIQNYWLCYSSFPYWCADDEAIMEMNFKSNAWMEGCPVPIYKDGEIQLLHYDPDCSERNQEDMQLLLDVTQREILPRLNSYDSVDFIINRELAELDKKENVWGTRGFINEFIILRKCYLDGSFAFAESYLKKLFSWLEENYSDFIQRRENGQSNQESIDRITKVHFSNLTQRMAENDINWIVGFLEQRKADMSERLKRDLKLDILSKQ